MATEKQQHCGSQMVIDWSGSVPWRHFPHHYTTTNLDCLHKACLVQGFKPNSWRRRVRASAGIPPRGLMCYSGRCFSVHNTFKEWFIWVTVDFLSAWTTGAFSFDLSHHQGDSALRTAAHWMFLCFWHQSDKRNTENTILKKILKPDRQSCNGYSHWDHLCFPLCDFFCLMWFLWFEESRTFQVLVVSDPVFRLYWGYWVYTFYLSCSFCSSDTCILFEPEIQSVNV